MSGLRSLAPAGPWLGAAVARIVGWMAAAAQRGDARAGPRAGAGVLAPVAADLVGPPRRAGGRGAPRSGTARMTAGLLDASAMRAPLPARPPRGAGGAER